MKCERCNGDGCIEKNIPGNEGVPEFDCLIVCPECDGTGIIPDMDIEELE